MPQSCCTERIWKPEPPSASNKIRTGRKMFLPPPACLHGFCPPRAAVLPVTLPPGLCGFIDPFHQITAQGIQFFYRVSAVFQTGIGRKGGGIVIDATVGGVQKQQRAGDKKPPAEYTAPLFPQQMPHIQHQQQDQPVKPQLNYRKWEQTRHSSYAAHNPWINMMSYQVPKPGTVRAHI